MEKIAEALARIRADAGSADAVAPVRPIGASREARRPAAEITYTRTRVVCSAPQVLRENRVISGFESGPLVDAYKILSIQVTQRLREKSWNALAVVSPGGGEGKTLTAINLAISLSLEVDQTVLLVDADLRNPSVHRYLALPEAKGLSDHFVSDVPLEDILVNPGLPRFVVLPGGRRLVNSAEMLGSQKMAKLVQELKSRYPSRIVVFDLPPVLSAADVLAFAPYVDAAVMVVAENQTGREQLTRASELLGAIGMIGVVLNRSLEARAATAPKPARRIWDRLRVPAWPRPIARWLARRERRSDV
jgi:capsular exopolysaccharide synthesis family protein